MAAARARVLATRLLNSGTDAMLLLAAVVTGAFVSCGIGLALWHRGAGRGERLLAAGLLVLGIVFAWIAATPPVGSFPHHLLATAPASAGPSSVADYLVPK